MIERSRHVVRETSTIVQFSRFAPYRECILQTASTPSRGTTHSTTYLTPLNNTSDVSLKVVILLTRHGQMHMLQVGATTDSRGQITGTRTVLLVS